MLLVQVLMATTVPPRNCGPPEPPKQVLAVIFTSGLQTLHAWHGNDGPVWLRNPASSTIGACDMALPSRTVGVSSRRW